MHGKRLIKDASAVSAEFEYLEIDLRSGPMTCLSEISCVYASITVAFEHDAPVQIRSPAVITSVALPKLGLYAGVVVTLELVEDALQREPESPVLLSWRRQHRQSRSPRGNETPSRGRGLRAASPVGCRPRDGILDIHLRGRVAPLGVQVHVSSGPAGQGTSKRAGLQS